MSDVQRGGACFWFGPVLSVRRLWGACLVPRAVSVCRFVWSGVFSVSRETRISLDLLGADRLMRAQLRRSGFAIIPAPAVRETCEDALTAFAPLRQFRYPPIPNCSVKSMPNLTISPNLTKAYRQAFNELYVLAARSLHCVLDTHPTWPREQMAPFPNSLNCEPFACEASSSLPYSASFGSLFNYDHGFLNAHVDRGLLTAVVGRPPSSGIDSSSDDAVRLWCRAHDDGAWLDVGEKAGPSEVVLFVGEQLEAASGGEFKAIHHCCRLDPTGGHIDTRLEAHPGAKAEGNRLSMALVLCEHDETARAARHSPQNAKADTSVL